MRALVTCHGGMPASGVAFGYPIQVNEEPAAPVQAPAPIRERGAPRIERDALAVADEE